MKITGSQITDNQSAYSGGGLFAIKGVALTISGSTLSGNTALQPFFAILLLFLCHVALCHHENAGGRDGFSRFGYGTARGSTSRGAVKALVQLKRGMAAGKPAAFTIDGPRGPARVAQPGAIWLAKATGNPIVPFHIESDRYWTANSWDRTMVPKPWARVAIAIGEPMEIDPRADEAAVEAGRLELESRLTSLERRAFDLLQSA